MAKALKCPACGATHRLDELDGVTKFRCDECGQSLKVPKVVVSATVPAESDGGASVAEAEAVIDGAAPPGNGSAAHLPAHDAPEDEDAARDADDPLVDDPPAGDAAASDASPNDDMATDTAVPMALASAAVPPPPPRRRAPGAPRGREIIGASATISASDGDGGRPASTSAPAREPATKRRRVRWYWRMLAWIAAVPIGFVITVWPSYELGLIRKDDVLDVFVGSGAGRYTRLAIVTVLWALVTALLVQLFVEGGRWWAARRRRRPSGAPQRGASASASAS